MADNTQQSPPVAQQPIETANGNNGRKRRPKPIVLAILAIIIVCGAIVTVRHLQYASCHQSTDNAFLTADVIQISAQVSGTVVSVAVSENQLVKAGDLLVVLDDKTYKANVAQAQANLNAAIALAKGAGVSVDVMAQTGSAQMQQAEGAVSQAQADIAGADANVAKDSAGIASAQAASSRAAAGIATAQAAVQAAIAVKAGSNDALSSAKSGLDAGRSDAERAERDAKRYSKLVTQGAVSEQTADQYASTALSLRSLVDQRAAQVAQAEQQRKVADATIAQAKAELLASQEQFRAAKAGIRQAKAVSDSAVQGVNQARAKHEQALGQLAQARTAPKQTDVIRTSREQALARVEQARAALRAATIQLEYTRIHAPALGRITKKSLEVGSLVQNGAPLMAIIPSDDIWVTANFKETQIAKMDPGDPAEIEVDGLPGEIFRGRVDSVSAATGSTFALLPPDNATGNFTKVVQRISVKIVLDKNQSHVDRLRAGMSVTAVVGTSN